MLSSRGHAATNSMAKGAIELEEDQEAKWIHRDKLTQIEIQEYRDRGMEPPAELLKRAAARRGETTRSRQAKYSDISISNENKRQRIQSPELSLDSPINYDDLEDDEPFVPLDPRTPEEIAQDPYEGGDYRQMGPKLRASSSKIPLAKDSPLPIPSEHLERDTPLKRTRGASEEWDDDYGSPMRIRSRSNSIGSQVLLDDENLNFGVPSSPSKARTQGKVRTPSNTSKIMNGKQRAPSGTSTAPRATSAQRPSTRSATNDRPKTGTNKPEGNPPWMDQMYKPDPMLPPDQQMLPTHAKRMAAEQWEREGKTGSVYDREFSPVQLYDEDKYKKQDEAETEEHQQRQSPQRSPFEPSNDSQWPLQASRLDVPVARSPVTEHGGYSTMPKVSKSPPIGTMPSPRIDSGPFQQQQSQQHQQHQQEIQQTQQQFEMEQEKEEEKTQGCCASCVVM